MGWSMEAERRRAQRVRVWFEVLRASPSLEGEASISDLSLADARLRYAGTPPQRGKPIRLAFRAGNGEPLVLSGVVSRRTEDGFAVTFDSPDPAVAALLEPLPMGGARLPVRGMSPIREVPVRCLAEGHWLSGRICLPPQRSLLDHLNHDELFLRILGAEGPEPVDSLDFVALRCDAVDLVLPDADQARLVPEPLEPPVTRRLRCLLPQCRVDGSFDAIDRVRVSDHLMRCPPFVALRDCLVRGMRSATPATPPSGCERPGLAMVNTRRVIGIADLEPPPPPAARDGFPD